MGACRPFVQVVGSGLALYPVNPISRFVQPGALQNQSLKPLTLNPQIHHKP